MKKLNKIKNEKKGDDKETMSSGQIENKLLDAIETVVNSAVARAGYDRTVQATVVRCENEAIGKYTVKYQDSLMYAYSSNLDTSYSNGTSVYVLIPSNDTGANKQIIGSVKKLGTDYLDNNEQNAYEYIGKNCIESDKEFGLCSYKPGQIITLYDKEANINEIDLNITDTELYLKNSNYLICGGNVRTNLNMEQQYAGNFGMVFELIFADNATGENIKRTYLLDVDAMHGNPYQLAAGVKQSNIFQIDGVNFKYVDKIYIFEKGFPNIATNKPEDIFFSNLELYGASLAPKDEDANCSLTVLTPQGIYFDNTYLETDSITLQAQIRVRGNVVDSKLNTLQYYWFRENNSITYTSEKYLKIGGAGWEFIDDNRNYQYTITKQDVPAKITKFKCVVVYNINTIVSKEVAIYNYSSPYEITIDSSKGTQFYYDLGETTLTCLINGEEQTSEDYTYVWSVVNNNGAFTSLTDGMEDYDIDKNKINNLSINTITNFSNFKCTAFYENINIGVGTITIKNDLDGGATYSLVIDNGDQVFKYNEQGISPASQSLDNPIEILPLSFTLYDNTGEEIPHSAIKSEDIKWKVPNNNSMITIVNGTTPIETEYYDIYNGHEISFKIDPKYNVRKLNNTIILEVSYKDNLFISKTNLSFLKEGDIGTNGTDFVCKIIPNLAYGNAPEHPMVILDKATGSYRLNYIPKTEEKWFKVQLWHDGENIFESTETGYSTESTEDIVSVSWGILKNKYDKTISDNSNFAINSENGEITFDISDFTSDENTPANIVKCSVVYKGITYYATMPIIIARIKDNSYYVNLKDNSGFVYGIYTTDGRNPQYDNTRPFEIELFQNDSDISQADILSYNWNVLGSIYISEWQSIQNLIAQKRLDLQKNQHVYRPIDENNGYCLSNAIYCSISNSTEEIASIHIPVHLFLNRYGNASMNGWDGNSININEDNGVILAPQVGAGQKEKDNSFTGVFMGSVSEAGSNEIETGLFGYSSGVRTIELNSKDGSAKFGKQGQGQIILDPNNDTATLKSGNYVAPVLDEDGNIITPGSGLEIDLTDPHITFGTGNFRVDSGGNVYAKGFATVKELNDGTIQIPTKAVDGLDSKLAGLEESIKYLDISMPTSIIAFTTDKDNKPLKTETETINYKATFKGQPIAARAVTTDTIENLSITTSIDETSKLGTITFEVTKDKAITNNKNVVTFTFSCIVDGITYTVQKEVSIILNVIGENGRSIESITEMYYSSANSTSLIDGSWSADYPGWVSGRYIWTKSVVEYSDGTTTETDPMCVSGENGKGISASAVEYQISTSGTDVPTGTWSSTLLTPSEGEYLWTRTTITYTTGDPSVSYSVSYHGTSGSDGKGISNTEINYQISTSGSDIPTGEWSQTIPTLEEDKFLWTRTIITYTDNTTSVSYSISRSGSTGSDGVGITKVDVEYYLSTSSSAPIGGEWSTTAPAWENGKYMWSRTKVYYTEGQPTTSEEVCISGARGTDGTSVTILGSYDDLEELIREHPTGNPGDSYIVGKHLFIWAVNTSEWKDVGQIEGNDGTNGETSYLHIKYSNDGGKTFTGHEGEDPGDYLGQYVDFTKEDSKDVTKYTWKLIKGTDGKNGIGISNVVEYYLVSPNKEGVTTETAGWGTAIPTMTKDNKYLWNYEEIIYTSGPSKTTTPKVIGMYGEEGKGVSSIVNYYLATNLNSGVTTTTSGWTETMQTATKDKKYLWNYEVVNYTDNTNYTSTPAIIGTYAENGISYYTHIRYSANADGTDYVQTPTTATKYIGIATTTSATAPTNKGSYTWSKYSGDDGKGVSTTTIEYKVSNNGSTPPTGTWSTTIPSITAGQYLWTRTTINYTSGDPSVSYTVSYQGIDGDSITIVEKSVTYQVSNSGTEEPQGSWSTTIPSVGPGKYLWTKSYVKYSDDTENTTYSVSYQGANGTSVSIASQKVEYAQGSSGTTKPTTGWQESIPAVPDGKYLWTRTTVKYSNGSKTESYSVSYQSRDGTSATQYYTYIKYADDASGTNMTDASTGKKFIGVAVSTSITPPTTASSYTWTKFVGDDATQYYTYIRYSAVSTGANMVETPTSSTKYIGTYVGTSASVPAYTSFKWSKYQGTDGTSPINIVCGNENQTIPCLSDGKVTTAMTIIIPFAGYEGSTRKACTVTYSTLPSGITLKSNTAATASADGSLQFSVAKDATLGGSDTGTITLTFTCSSKTFTKTFVWSKAKAGLNGGKGDQGVSVTKVDEIYFLSSSNTTAPTLPTTHVTSTSTDSGVWTTVCPKWKQNYFYWTSSEIAYSDGHYTWSNAVLNSGLNSALNDANNALNNSNTALEKTIVEKEVTDYPIYIEDAGEIDAISTIIYGKSEQETRSGKNLFNPTLQTTTINGITCTNNGDGTYTLNGTATAGTSIDIFPENTIPSGTYKLIGCPSGGSTSTFYLASRYDGVWGNSDTGNGATISFTTFGKLSLSIQNGVKFTNAILKPMITSDTSLTYNDYEPYGASPSPDYPSEIDTVGIKNLFDGNRKNIYFNSSKVFQTIEGAETTDYIQAKEGDKFIMTSSSTSDGLVIASFDSNKNCLKRDAARGTKVIHTCPANTKYVIGSNYIATTTLTMFEKGNKASNIYVPYGNWLVEKITGKNLFNYVDNLLPTVNGLTNTLNADGSITTTGVPTKNYVQIFELNNITDLLEDGAEYTISQEVSSPELKIVVGAITQSGSTRYYTGDSGSMSFVVNKKNYEKYIAWVQCNTTTSWGTSSRTITNKYMLCKGTDTIFEPYKEKIVKTSLNKDDGTYYELCKIGDIKDEIDTTTGILTKRIGKVVLDGSDDETYNRITSGSNENYIQINANLGLSNIDNSVSGSMLKCTHFQYYQNATGSTKNQAGVRIYDTNTNLVFSIPTTIATNVATFRTWLLNNPVTVYYVLAEPKQITLPNANIPLFEGINHIYIESNLEPDSMYLKYYTNSEINNSVKEANKNFAPKSKTTAYYTTTITPDLPGKDVEWLDNVTSSTELYIWQKFITTYDNGANPIETTPSCIYTPAARIHDTKTQYCIHTSNTIAPDSATALWENNRPEWKKEYYQEGTKKYLWVRTIYEYINPAKIEYSTAYYDPSWEDLGWLDAAIDESAEKINGAINNGNVKIHDGVIEIIKDPTNAIMFSSAGISFKLNGEYTSVWDIDGTFNAQLIQVKQLNANSILSGTLTLKAASDDTNGRFILQNRNGKEVALIDVNGLTVTATDGSKIQLKTNEDGTGKGLYLYDAFGHEFVHTNTSQGILEVTKQKITEYQDFSTNIRIITVTDGIGFVGI